MSGRMAKRGPVPVTPADVIPTPVIRERRSVPSTSRGPCRNCIHDEDEWHLGGVCCFPGCECVEYEPHG